MTRSRRFLCLLALGWLVVPAALADSQNYQSPDAFVAEAFAGDPPTPQTVWLVGDLGEAASEILGHPPNRLRERYWRRGNRSVWILEEVGKERPITVGWILRADEVTGTEVLIYRESRGWEVRYPSFTGQFDGAELTTDLELDRNIDGISGATLSVRAMRNMARLALLLQRHVIANDDP